MDNLYVPQTLQVRINLDPSELTNNYEDKIRDKIRNRYGDVCGANGFIRKSSIELTKIETGHRQGSHLRGMITFDVEFKALFCVPISGKTIRCKIQTVNKFGAQAVAYPMEVLIPRQLQQQSENLDVFKDLKENDYVHVKILNYTVSESKLIVVGTITDVAIDKLNYLELPSDGLLSPNYTVVISQSKQVPTGNALLGDNTALNQLKNRITPYASMWDMRIKYMINPYELIDIYRSDKSASKKYNKSLVRYDNEEKEGVYPVCSRAYYKLWEILSELKLLDAFKGVPITVANIAEGPGGFIHAMIDQRNKQNAGSWKNDQYYAITLKASKDADVMDWECEKSANYFKQAADKGYKVKLSYGAGDGDLLKMKNINHFVKNDMGDAKCDLVTADGGIELENDAEYELQELANAKLFFSEILTALMIQKKGGTFVLKLYDIYYDITKQLVGLLSIYYGQLTLIKPRTSRPANSEKYLVCRGFNGIDEQQLNQLVQLQIEWVKLEANKKYLLNTSYVQSLFQWVENSGSVFTQNLAEFNNYNINLQIDKITEGLNLVKTHDASNKETQSRYKATQKELGGLWCEKFGIPYIKDLQLT